MTNWLEVVTLAVVQGLTEFIPVSSSAHLILVPKLSGWSDQGLNFDIALHVGTLIAVLVYFRHDLKLMIRDTFARLQGGEKTLYSQMSFQIALATVPVGLAGLFFYKFISEHMRSPLIIATSTIVFGILLLCSDLIPKRNENTINYRQALIIGLAQVLSLIPGTSRSGITLTAGLSLGLSRQTAARFSFLMAIPVVLLAMILELRHLYSAQGPQPWLTYGVGVTISALVALFCIHYFLKLLDTLGVLPFVIYRLFLGVFLFCVF